MDHLLPVHGMAFVFWLFGYHALSPRDGGELAASLLLYLLVALAGPALYIAFQVIFLPTLAATPGKLVAGLRVMDERGRPPTRWRAFVRAVAAFPGALLFGFGYWSALWDEHARTWHDRRANTFVVREASARTRFAGRDWRPGVLGLVVSVVLGVASFWPAHLALAPPGAASSLERHLALAADAHARGDLARALAEYTSALEVDPDRVMAYVNRGAVHGDMGNLDLQLEDCERALAREPGQVFALLNRANVHRLRGETDAAIADYSEVIRVRPDWSGLVYAHRGRGAVLCRGGDLVAGAAADFQEGARVATLNYVGRSDHPKDARFGDAIATCWLLQAEVLRRRGQAAAGEAILREHRSQIEMLGPATQRAEFVEAWLGRP